MPQLTPLLEIVNEIDKIFSAAFKGKTYWIKSDISGIRKAGAYGYYYLDFIDNSTGRKIIVSGICKFKGIAAVKLYESMTGNIFHGELNIICKVEVSYYKDKNYPQLEILEIDYATEVGRQEIEKRQNLEKLLKENPKHIKLVQGKYVTTNNSLQLPMVIQNIALITAHNSDGQRDFLKSIQVNKYGYDFAVTPFLSLMQGIQASSKILERLKEIEKLDAQFDIAVICRGGGSDSDFHSFNDFELSNYICSYPIPILTGIGHDRNTSIVDMVSKQLMNPAQVGSFIIDRNMKFNASVQELEQRLNNKIADIFYTAKDAIETFGIRINNLTPAKILKKGFAIISMNDKIITEPKHIKIGSEITTQLKNENIYSKVNKKKKK